MENNFPDNWAVTTLNDVCSIDTGKWDSNHSTLEGKYRFYTCAYEHLLSDTKRFSGNCVILPGNGANVGEVFFYDGEFDAYQRTYVLSNFQVDSKYAYYHLKYQWKEINKEKQYGSATNFIKIGNFLEYEILLPPLPEQHRIVAKLDAVMQKVESNKQRLEKIPKLLKRFRQSVLAFAISGKLTDDWRKQNDFNAFEELNQIKNRREKENKKGKLTKKEKAFANIEFQINHEIKGWAKAKLDNLIYISARIGWRGLKAEEYTSSGPLFLSVHSLNYGDNVNFAKAYHISEDRFLESTEIALQENDILLCKDGAGIGKLGLVKNLKEKATVNSSLLVIRSLEAFHYKFLYYFLLGPALQNIVKERMTGTAVPHVFQKDIKEFILDVPPLKEQKEIVKRIEQLFAFVDKLEARYTKTKTMIDKLPQSILAKAFRGELVPQNPNDEPASVLLDRIKKEKEKLNGEKKEKKRKRTTL